MNWQAGDILACYGGEPLSRIISYGTFTPFAPRGVRVAPSHVGIISEHEGEPCVFESTTLANRPCVVNGSLASGIQCQRPFLRVWDYTHRGGRVDVYRLTRWNQLDRSEAFQLSELLLRMTREHLTYDTGGALLSGTRVFQFSRLFPAADLERLFCSELVAFLLMRFNRMARCNPTRFNPGRLVRHLIACGTYQKVDSHV